MSRTLQVQYRNQNTNTRVIGTTRTISTCANTQSPPGACSLKQTTTVASALPSWAPPSQRISARIAAESAVGYMVRIGGIQFEVIGVLAPKGGAVDSTTRTIRCSFRSTPAASACSTRPNLQSINVLAASEAQIPQAMTEIESILRRQHRLPSGRDDDFEIRNQADFLNALAADDAGVRPPARRHRGGQPARRRHRHHEHHARLGHRAHARDRHPQGDRRDAAQHPRCSS